MTDIVTASVKGIIRNCFAALVSIGTEMQLPLGGHGQVQTADIHGRFFEAMLRNKLFTYNVTGVTIPVIANNLVSVFSLWNPPGSNVLGEIVRTTLGQVLATTVVDTVGWYSSTASATALGTFTTLASARSSQMQSPPSNAIKPYSAYTHSGTPTREDLVGAFGAVTDAAFTLPDKQYDGMLGLPAGIATSLAMSTAAGFTSGLDAQVIWAEWPTS